MAANRLLMDIARSASHRPRGRASAAEYVVGIGCPRLGDFRVGAVGSLASPAVKAVSGGLATVVASAVTAMVIPAFFRYRAAQIRLWRARGAAYGVPHGDLDEHGPSWPAPRGRGALGVGIRSLTTGRRGSSPKRPCGRATWCWTSVPVAAR